MIFDLVLHKSAYTPEGWLTVSSPPLLSALLS
jgi:hypothetical protein